MVCSEHLYDELQFVRKRCPFAIKRSVCGVKIEEIEAPLMLKIRWLDKLVDELAKGKPIDKIKR